GGRFPSKSGLGPIRLGRALSSSDPPFEPGAAAGPQSLFDVLGGETTAPRCPEQDDALDEQFPIDDVAQFLRQGFVFENELAEAGQGFGGALGFLEGGRRGRGGDLGGKQRPQPVI